MNASTIIRVPAQTDAQDQNPEISSLGVIVQKKTYFEKYVVGSSTPTIFCCFIDLQENAQTYIQCDVKVRCLPGPLFDVSVSLHI